MQALETDEKNVYEQTINSIVGRGSSRNGGRSLLANFARYVSSIFSESSPGSRGVIALDPAAKPEAIKGTWVYQ